MIGGIYAGAHGGVEGVGIGLLKPFKGFGHARKDAGKDYAGVAARAQQHALGNGSGHIGELSTAGAGTRLYGHVHIVPGVSIGDGKNV